MIYETENCLQVNINLYKKTTETLLKTRSSQNLLHKYLYKLTGLKYSIEQKPKKIKNSQECIKGLRVEIT